MSSTIFEVLEQGPVVAGDEEMGYLVTINGSYLNLWSRSSVVRWAGVYGGRRFYSEHTVWNNIDCRPTGRDMYSMTSAEAWDLGKEWLAEILADLNAEDDDHGNADSGDE